jgi:chaperonin cofactor prefoldin
MHWDQDVGMPMAGERADGERVRRDDASVHREIGELLLHVDELEDTLQVMEARPEIRVDTGPEPPRETMRRLEDRIRAERAKIQALERRGAIQYDEIERAIRLSETMA